uniref:Uncharacterized protein n=1 Tax=Anguilla anguilla TaxID=7936 RepID=A0A0E9SRN9_ANGAN
MIWHLVLLAFSNLGRLPCKKTFQMDTVN